MIPIFSLWDVVLKAASASALSPHVNPEFHFHEDVRGWGGGGATATVTFR